MLNTFRPAGPVGINWGTTAPATGARRPNQMPRMRLETAEEVTAHREPAHAGGCKCPARSAG